MRKHNKSLAFALYLNFKLFGFKIRINVKR